MASEQLRNGVSALGSGLSRRVKLVYLVLIVNGVPATILLTFAAGNTNELFVWTVEPDASAQLLGVMYSNALILVLIGLWQGSWPGARVTVLLISVFAVTATIVTFFHLDPFLDHPWTHLAYWLTMYLVLVVAAPLTFIAEERARGGRLPVEVPLSAVARGVAIIAVVGLGALGVALIASPSAVSDVWPWNLTPLVARILGVWFSSLAVAYLWALADGDWLRGRPIFWQALPTGVLLGLVPLVRPADVEEPIAVYVTLAALLAASGALTAFAGTRNGSATRQR